MELLVFEQVGQLVLQVVARGWLLFTEALRIVLLVVVLLKTVVRFRVETGGT